MLMESYENCCLNVRVYQEDNQKVLIRYYASGRIRNIYRDSSLTHSYYSNGRLQEIHNPQPGIMYITYHKSGSIKQVIF